MTIKNIANRVKNFSRRTTYVIVAFSVTGILVGTDIGLATNASASQLTTRSVTVTSSALGNITNDSNGNAQAAGSGGNGQKTGETFNFTLATTSKIQTMLFEWCTTPIAGSTCTSPTGFTAANVSAITQSGFTAGTFAVDTSTVLTGAPWNCTGSTPGRTNCLAVNRSDPTTTEASGTAVSIIVTASSSNYITNPTTTGTFFVRITTYSDTAYATQVDYGTVASSTATQINITAKVQETLNFSVGSTITAPGAGCTAYTDAGTLALGDSNGALNTSNTFYNHSYFRIATNDLHGATIQYTGQTLTSPAANTITALGTTATAPAIGTSQFGLAIDTHDTESGSGYSFSSLSAATTYNNGNDGSATSQSGSSASLGGTYAFSTASNTTPVTIASSTTPITCDTGSVMYIANVSTTTPSGVYTSLIGYIAIPSY